MSVVVADAINIRPWRGYDDPGLPVGMYFAQNSVTGDATGGGQTVIFEFKGENEPVSGRFFNIEQMNAFFSDVNTRAASMLINNFETLGPVGLVNRQYRLQLENNLNSVAALNADTFLPLPLFLGSVAPVASLAAQVEFRVPNVDLTSWVVTIQGYIWEPRSVQAEGGLRRPTDALYGGGRR